jgi:hypothetical protein
MQTGAWNWADALSNLPQQALRVVAVTVWVWMAGLGGLGVAVKEFTQNRLRGVAGTTDSEECIGQSSRAIVVDVIGVGYLIVGGYVQLY